MNLLHGLEEFLKHNRRSTLLIGAVITTALLLYSAHLDRQVAIRNHNLDVMAEIMRCSKHESVNSDDCEMTMGKFMLPETGLFTREEQE